MLAEQVDILLTIGEQRRAAELAARLEGLRKVHEHATGAFAHIRAIAALVRAQLAQADSNHRVALEALAEVRAFGEQYGRAPTVVRANLLAAVAHDGLQQDAEATRCLTEAVTLAAKLGLVRTLLDTKAQTARFAGPPAERRQPASARGSLPRGLAGEDDAGHRTAGRGARGRGSGVPAPAWPRMPSAVP
ncbi:hypothetical protein ACU4HD_10480 [Cupriavidus basilensis]